MDKREEGMKKKKVLMFEIEFTDNPEIEELVRKVVGCLNTSQSKVYDLSEEPKAPPEPQYCTCLDSYYDIDHEGIWHCRSCHKIKLKKPIKPTCEPEGIEELDLKAFGYTFHIQELADKLNELIRWTKRKI